MSAAQTSKCSFGSPHYGHLANGVAPSAMSSYSSRSSGKKTGLSTAIPPFSECPHRSQVNVPGASQSPTRPTLALRDRRIHPSGTLTAALVVAGRKPDADAHPGMSASQNARQGRRSAAFANPREIECRALIADRSRLVSRQSRIPSNRLLRAARRQIQHRARNRIACPGPDGPTDQCFATYSAVSKRAADDRLPG